jgi:tetratricopeptide (TPR) repeat protein
VNEEDLPAAAEADWDRLRRQFAYSTQSWIGFVFVSSPNIARTLRRRTERLVRQQGGRFAAVDVTTPGRLAEATPQLLGDATREAACVWLEAAYADAPGGAVSEPGPWMRAVESLFLRLNERREGLLQHIRGGFMAVLAPAAKWHVRIAAPDLWSVRRVVIEPALVRQDPIASVEARERTLERAREPASDKWATNLRLSPEAAGSPLASSLARVSSLLASGATGEAVELGRDALAWVEGRPSSPSDLTVTLAWLSRAEEEDGDTVAAADHAERALRLDALETDLMLELLYRVLDSADLANDPNTPAGLLVGAVDRLRREAGRGRDLLDVLLELGRLYEARGEGSLATASYSEALALARRLRDQVGETPQTLRDLSISLDRVGDVRREVGDLAAAGAALEESLALARRLRDQVGETPQTLRDLSISLDKVGDLRREMGDLAAAATVYEEAAELRGSDADGMPSESLAGPDKDIVRDVADNDPQG